MTIQELKQHWKNLPRDLANMHLERYTPPWFWVCIAVIFCLVEMQQRYWRHWDSFTNGFACALALHYLVKTRKQRRQVRPDL